MKQVKEFKDAVGKPLAVGDLVAFASYKNLGLTIGQIAKIGRLNVTINGVPDSGPVTNTAPWLVEENWQESFRPAEVVKV